MSQPTPGPTYGHQQTPVRRLVRTDDRVIGGVCAGLAHYLGVDPTIVRVLAVVALVFGFPATVVAYLVAWAVVPHA